MLTGLRKVYIRFASICFSYAMVAYTGTRIKVVKLTEKDIGSYEEYLGSIQEQKKC